MVIRKLIAIGLPLSSGASFAQAPAYVVPAPTGSAATLLEVQAEGEALSAPDRASISGGVVTTGETPREAIDSNALAMTKIVSALLAKGVAKSDITTQNISIEPQFDYETRPGSPTIRGYIARNQASVELRTIDRASEIVAALFESGANSVNGPYFGLKDASAATATARENAVANALTQANTYAKAFGMRVDRIVRISERQRFDQYVPDTITLTGDSFSGGSAPPPPPPPPALMAARPPISAGSMKVTAKLWVDFSLSQD